MAKVLNRKTDTILPDAIYVGRAMSRFGLRDSKWGNPFKITSSCGRLEVIQRYREYAIQRLEENPHWLDELRGKDLVCWCAPLACHGDVLLELINQSPANHYPNNVEGYQVSEG